MANLMTMLTAFVGSPGTDAAGGTGMMGVWQAVVDFVTASGNEISLIGTVAFLFVMGVGGIRKLITGV